VRRFESKHRKSELGANSKMSDVNLKKSLGINHPLSLCNRFVANASTLPGIEVVAGVVFKEREAEFRLVRESLKEFFPYLNVIFMPNRINYQGSHIDDKCCDY